jgi:hypothetical protein
LAYCQTGVSKPSVNSHKSGLIRESLASTTSFTADASAEGHEMLTVEAKELKLLDHIVVGRVRPKGDTGEQNWKMYILKVSAKLDQMLAAKRLTGKELSDLKGL